MCGRCHTMLLTECTLEKFTVIDEDILQAAVDAYNVQKIVEPDKDAVRTALAASLAKFERRVQERIGRGAFAYAEALQERTGADEDDPGPQAVREFASSLMMELPGDDYTYEPEEGDVVEISLVGELQLQSDECPNCHHELGTMEWGLTDRYTGNQYWFEDMDFSKARVRVVMRGVDFDSVSLDSEED